MSLRLEQVVLAHAGLKLLVKADDADRFLSFRTKLAINARFRKMKSDMEAYENERLAIYKQFGIPLYDNGIEKPATGYKAPESGEALEQFNSRLKELLDSEAELDSIKPLTAAQLGENKLSVAVLEELQGVGVLEITDEE